VRYQFVQTQEGLHQIVRLCAALAVSRSGYYAWRRRAESRRQQANRVLLTAIREAHQRSKERYGAVKLWRALVARGIPCGRHRVARLRRLYGIETRRMRRFRRLIEHHQLPPPAPNRLAQHFAAPASNRIWLGDVTAIATRAGWLYLAVVLDLYSRCVVGWAMSPKPDQQLAIGALVMAVQRRQPRTTLLHHTDQGAQYASVAYHQLLHELGFIASMSRKGNCYDNAVVESFFSTLKNELIHDRDYHTRDEARTEIFEFIEVFYNRQRLHQSLGYVSPEAFEAEECTLITCPRNRG
jgi:transposase InsO family protein